MGVSEGKLWVPHDASNAQFDLKVGDHGFTFVNTRPTFNLQGNLMSEAGAGLYVCEDGEIYPVSCSEDGKLLPLDKRG